MHSMQLKSTCSLCVAKRNSPRGHPPSRCPHPHRSAPLTLISAVGGGEYRVTHCRSIQVGRLVLSCGDSCCTAPRPIQANRPPHRHRRGGHADSDLIPSRHPSVRSIPPGWGRRSRRTVTVAHLRHRQANRSRLLSHGHQPTPPPTLGTNPC